MVRKFDPYSSLNIRTEPDMRQEFRNTIKGFYPEISKGQQLVHRKMRTNSNGELIQCACVDPLTMEPDLDTYCPICFGERYIWDESIVSGYKVVRQGPSGLAGREQLASPGTSNLALVSFYFEFDIPLTLIPNRPSPDRVVELVTDLSGKPVRPYKRETLYSIGSAIDFRSDNGKVEYWKLDCYERKVKFLNGPKG